MNIVRRFSLLLLVLLYSKPSVGCQDNDEMIAEFAARRGYEGVTGCSDVSRACSLQNKVGERLREVCCETCKDYGVVESIYPPNDGETVQVFLLSGQSECVGSADPDDVNSDPKYSELHGDIDGVWFAGYSGRVGSVDSFFVQPMKADVGDRFGPEVSFGERYHNITGERVLILKYCRGGTNVHTHWNPTTADNTWDTEDDNGTAQWMSDNAGLDFQSKNSLFKNMVYTIRRFTEAFDDQGLFFEWKGIIWVHGNGDSREGDPIWKTFGENTAQLWDALRDTIGVSVPIIDQGSSTKSQLKSGKEYATLIVGQAKNIEWARSANDEDASDCVVGPGNPCLGENNTYINPDFYNYYGFDPQVPEDLKPPGSTNKTFRWWKNFPYDMHSAYEGMILKGRTLANHFVLEFTEYDLPSDFAESDPALKFPWLTCEAGTSPGEDNYCWIDHRDEDLMIDLHDESMSLKGSVKSISFEEDESIPFIFEEDESIPLDSSASAMSCLVYIGSALYAVFGTFL